MNKEHAAQIWVHPRFKKLLKQKAIEENSSILSYTKRLSQEQDPFENIKKFKEQRRPPYAFRI